MGYYDLDEFLQLDQAPNGEHEIVYGGVSIHVELEAESFQPLIVCFHGAKSSKVILPWLVGKNMVKSLPASRLSISDPSLQLNDQLTLAWYIGNSQQPHLQQVIDKIVQKFAADWSASRTIFFGGSGGGFATIRATYSNPGSIGVCFNPQTDIAKYHQAHQQRFFKYCWSGESESIPNEVVTSTVDQYASGPFTGKLLYLQNSTDFHHTARHLSRFLQSAAGNGDIYLGLTNWSERHTPPPQQILRSVLCLAMYGAPHEALKEFGFIRQ